MISTAALAPFCLPHTDRERKFFQLFSTRVVSQLTGLFGSAFWERHVLQASLHEPAIWHALVALGAVHQTFKPVCQLQTSKVGQLRTSDPFAVHQYLKAMGHLINPGPKDVPLSWDVALICCVLFICFEVRPFSRPFQYREACANVIQCLHGRYEAAIAHLDSGIKLLSERRSNESKGGQNESQSSKIPYVRLQDMEIILIRLDTQASQILSTRRPSFMHSIQTGLRFPKQIETLEDARVASDHLWNNCLYTLALQAHTQTTDNATSKFGHTLASSVQVCYSKFEQWSSTFQEFFTRYNAKSNKPDAREQRILNIMQIDQLIAKLCMKTNVVLDFDNEKHWDENDAEFAEIVFRANEIIDSYSNTDGEIGLHHFCLDTSVVGPLYFVACRCRHKILRRKAISLLRMVRRQEGLWNSSMLASIAEQILRIEEGLGENGDEHWTHVNVVQDIPAESRIADVVLDFQGESGEAGVQYLTTKGSSILKGDGRLKITWS
jgi:hypothetical protein